MSAFEPENLIALLPGHIYWKDKQGVYLGCNEAFSTLLGLKRNEIVGKTDYDFLSQKEANKIREADKKAMQEKVSIGVEEKVISPDGKVIFYFSQKIPLYNEKKEVIGLLGNSVNITKQKETEKKLKEEKRKTAELTNKLKTEFIHNMEHDIRTPFMGIFSIAQYLAQQEAEPKKKKLLTLLSESAHELLDYCNHILKFSSDATLAQPILEKPFKLRELVDSLGKIERPAIEQKQLAFKSVVEKTAPNVLIGDPHRLKRILLNLLSNAVKFTEAGSITLEVRLGKWLKAENQVILTFSVTDTGIGIPEDKKDLIYEQFVRLSPSNKGLYKGQGLGLYLVKELVDELGGTILVSSQVGEGTTFTVQLAFKLPLLGDETQF